MKRGVGGLTGGPAFAQGGLSTLERGSSHSENRRLRKEICRVARRELLERSSSHLEDRRLRREEGRLSK
ncbi:hypothetical protein U1Q18_046257, partial [Sarracenia purpurea var. burkii]